MKRGKDVKKQRVKRGILWLLVIAVAGAIFFFSSMDGPESMELSSGFTDWLMRRFHPDYDLLAPEKQEEFYQLFVFIVRKTAHFTEFAALGAALMLLIHEYTLRRGPLWAWGIGTLYAGTDELHQLFKGTRTPALRDVAIDSAGVLFGVLFVALLLYIIDRWKGKRTA